MSSVFRLDDNHVEKPNRNNFDMSFANNLTMKMGQLVPAYVQPVMPGDSIKIDPKFALRYLPQVFPTQTRQRASLKFYYVRNRNLWKDFEDFIGKTKQGLVPPYVNLGDDPYFLSPSTLADYMGVPMRVYPVYGDMAINEYKMRFPWIYSTNGDYVYVPNSNQLVSNIDDPLSIRLLKNISVKLEFPTIDIPNLQSGYFLLSDWYGGAAPKSSVPLSTFFKYSSSLGSSFRPAVYSKVDIRVYRRPIKFSSILFTDVTDSNNLFIIFRLTDGRDVIRKFNSSLTGQTISPSIKYYELTPDDEVKVAELEGTIDSVVGFIYARTQNDFADVVWPSETTMSVFAGSDTNTLYWCDIDPSQVPFASTANPDGKRISALPFRAYQAVYNALIRNAENNPFLINGQPEYNKYIKSNEGGMRPAWECAEEYYANWADDRFTTALPSPQQGNAPLVGLTGTQGAILTIGNEDGTTQRVKLEVDSTTGYVVGVNVAESQASEDIISESWNAVDYGISINDFRNVNAYQRWKENNIRRGYKYKDQISAHYGVSVRYEVLDMPEFIGGVSRDVDVQQITQTTENQYGNLGDIAGQSYVMGDGQTINHYCDEHGWIIGILSVTPTPLYFDTLPKYLLLNDTLDYFFPEFGKIGPQPILNQELAFSQSVKRGTDENTFGYQRAWYHELERLDEVHGMFRDDFRDYLIGRDFAEVPSLGSQFLTMNSEDINNTFYTDDNKDKILGQIYFNVTMKRPIPLYGIPSIE